MGLYLALRQDDEEKAESDRIRTENLMMGNPLLRESADFSVKRRYAARGEGALYTAGVLCLLVEYCRGDIVGNSASTVTALTCCVCNVRPGDFIFHGFIESRGQVLAFNYCCMSALEWMGMCLLSLHSGTHSCEGLWCGGRVRLSVINQDGAVHLSVPLSNADLLFTAVMANRLVRVVDSRGYIHSTAQVG